MFVFSQVVVCKFHSVFLSQKGQVFTCGHGQGGRLGHGDEQTYLVGLVCLVVYTLLLLLFPLGFFNCLSVLDSPCSGGPGLPSLLAGCCS